MNTMFLRLMIAIVLTFCASAISMAQTPVTNPEQTRTVFKSEDGIEWETTEALTLVPTLVEGKEKEKWEYREVSRVAVKATHENKMEVVADKPEKVEPAATPVSVSTAPSAPSTNVEVAVKPTVEVVQEAPTMVQDNTPLPTVAKTEVPKEAVKPNKAHATVETKEAKPVSKLVQNAPLSNREASSILEKVQDAKSSIELYSTLIYMTAEKINKLSKQQTTTENNQNEQGRQSQALRRQRAIEANNFFVLIFGIISAFIFGFLAGIISSSNNKPESDREDYPDPDDGIYNDPQGYTNPEVFDEAAKLAIISNKIDADEEETIPPVEEEPIPTNECTMNKVFQTSYIQSLQQLRANEADLADCEIRVMQDSDADAKQLFIALTDLLKSSAKSATLYGLEAIIVAHPRSTYTTDRKGKDLFLKVGMSADQMGKHLEECRLLRLEAAKNQGSKSHHPFGRADIGTPGL